MEDIRRLVVEAGYTPVERDTLYRRVIRNSRDWHVENQAQTTTDSDQLLQER